MGLVTLVQLRQHCIALKVVLSIHIFVNTESGLLLLQGQDGVCHLGGPRDAQNLHHPGGLKP